MRQTNILLLRQTFREDILENILALTLREREKERVEGVVEFGETLTKVQAIRNCKLHFAFLVIQEA